MPPYPALPPYYLGALLAGALALGLRLRIRRGEVEAAIVRHPRRLAALFVALLVVVGGFGALTFAEGLQASTWVYHYSLAVDTADTTSGSIVLPIPADASLLAGLRANRTAVNWSYVSTGAGPGLYVSFRGPCSLEAALRLFAPLGGHPDPGLAPQRGNHTTGQVWIAYVGDGPVDANFQYGSGYVISGAAVYIGPLKPGWSNYSLVPAP